MAELIPTNPSQHSGGDPEGKPDSSAKTKAPPSLLDDLLYLLGEGWKLLQELAGFGRWCAKNPLAALALAGIVATLGYFFGWLHPYMYGSISTARWAWAAWSPEGDQSYGRMVPFIAMGLFVYHREALRKAPAGGYALGWIPLMAGILLFVLSVRCLNPRMGLASVPFLLYGAVHSVWGRAKARVVFFPCAFLVFMIPVGALQQATNHLQFIIIGVIKVLSPLCGIGIGGSGTTLMSTDGSFNFDIAEGCSGIHSLMAMMTLTAVFVHLTQDRLWKKVTIFGCSLVFAIIGNIGRIFSVELVAKYYDPKVALGIYHEYSGYFFFPIAFIAMLLFSWLVNLDFKKLATSAGAKARTLEKKPTSYDY